MKLRRRSVHLVLEEDRQVVTALKELGGCVIMVPGWERYIEGGLSKRETDASYEDTPHLESDPLRWAALQRSLWRLTRAGLVEVASWQVHCVSGVWRKYAGELADASLHRADVYLLGRVA
jgi:hypothetical protein